jgi:hypothetical protein
VCCVLGGMSMRGWGMGIRSCRAIEGLIQIAMTVIKLWSRASARRVRPFFSSFFFLPRKTQKWLKAEKVVFGIIYQSLN